MTAVGLLNFLVLQWFGVRLEPRFRKIQVNVQSDHAALVRGGASLGYACVLRRERDGWRLCRWVWPLTGWWSEYRWISRK